MTTAEIVGAFIAGLTFLIGAAVGLVKLGIWTQERERKAKHDAMAAMAAPVTQLQLDVLHLTERLARVETLLEERHHERNS